MRKSVFIFLCVVLFYSLSGQKSCFDAANLYRAKYLNQLSIDFDSLTFYLTKGQNMLINCSFPNDTFTTISNNHLSIKKFKGKMLVINFWSVHCAPCINEIPSFHELKKKYKNLEVLAFTLDSKNEVEQFLQKNQFAVEIMVDARSFVEKYSLGSGYPFTLLVDTKGKIIYVKSGGKTEPESRLDLYKELSPYIDKALKDR